MSDIDEKIDIPKTMRASGDELLLAISLFSDTFQPRAAEASLNHLEQAWLYMVQAMLTVEGESIKKDPNNKYSMSLSLRPAWDAWKKLATTTKRLKSATPAYTEAAHYKSLDDVKTNLKAIVEMRNIMVHQALATDSKISHALAPYFRAALVNYCHESREFSFRYPAIILEHDFTISRISLPLSVASGEGRKNNVLSITHYDIDKNPLTVIISKIRDPHNSPYIALGRPYETMSFNSSDKDVNKEKNDNDTQKLHSITTVDLQEALRGTKTPEKAAEYIYQQLSLRSTDNFNFGSRSFWNNKRMKSCDVIDYPNGKGYIVVPLSSEERRLYRNDYIEFIIEEILNNPNAIKRIENVVHAE